MKLLRQLLILFFLPAISFAQKKGIDRYELDTVQSLISGKSIYEFNLKSPSQGFYIGELQSDSLIQIELKIINNTGKTLVNSYRERDCSVMWLRVGRYDTLKPGESMLLRSAWLNRIGPINCPIFLTYSIDGENMSNIIRTWGEILPSKEKSSLNNDVSLVKKKEEKPEEENKKVKTSTTPSYHKRPDGVQWFGKGTLHEYNPNITNYEFRIENNKLHYSASPNGVNDIFAWDTLTPEHYGKEYIFNFKNESTKTLYILDITAYSKNFNTKFIGKNILLPDSSTRISFRADSTDYGNFYGYITITYQREGKNENYDMGLWGFQPSKNNISKRAKSYNKTDTVAFLLIDKEQKTQKNYTLKITQNNKVYYPKCESVNNEFVYFIPREYKDSIWYEVIDKNKKVMSKGLITNKFKERNLFVWANDSRESVHTYSYYSGPRKYEAMNGTYFIQWNNEFKRDEVVDYLKSKGVEISYVCQPYFKMDDEKKVFELQKEIIKSKYKIVILPVISYSHVNSNGWGGGCEYYNNTFYISFYKNVSKEKIASIFKQAGITDYKDSGNDTVGLKKYSFTISTIIDLQYMKTLDKLWDLPEVHNLDQEIYNMPGLD